MRALAIVIFFCTTGAFAQLGAPTFAPGAPESTWTIGVQSFGPTITGHFEGSLDGQQNLVDLNAGLGLGKDKSKMGFFLDYQSAGYGFQVSTGSSEYRGGQVLAQPVTIHGVNYPVGSTVQSWMKLASLTGIWTLKLVNDPDAWLGLDLGLQSWTLDLKADGTSGSPTNPGPSSVSVKLPVPLVGLSGGSRLYNGAIESKAFVRYMNAKGGKFTQMGVDCRMFLNRWFGLRVFYENSRLDAPKGAVKDDLDLRITSKGTGFGGVIRF